MGIVYSRCVQKLALYFDIEGTEYALFQKGKLCQHFSSVSSCCYTEITFLLQKNPEVLTFLYVLL